MHKNKVFVNLDPSDAQPLTFDPAVCNGCNRCVEICQVDIMIPNPAKGKPPVVAYSSECWYCGCCVAECPRSGAVQLNSLARNSVHWKRKTTGEDFWL